MAEFSPEEKQILSSVLPNIAEAMRLPLNNLHMAVQRLAAPELQGTAESAIMQQSYYRMLRMVSNLTMGPELLSDAPFETQNLELVVWLDELCRQADSIARETGIKVEFICRERYIVTAVHRTYLERLVWNLLSNALKFTPASGHISVTLEVKGQQVLLSVKDTGPGIPPEDMETVFDRWTQSQRPISLSHGIGLGLLICRRVAEGHGGRLLLESREGQGTLVTVALPHVRRGGEVRDVRMDYAGGFPHVMMELSDALPYRAFTEVHLD